MPIINGGHSSSHRIALLCRSIGLHVCITKLYDDIVNIHLRIISYNNIIPTLQYCTRSSSYDIISLLMITL